MADLSKYDMSAVALYNRRHINYQASTRYDGIWGILDLDKEFEIPSVSDPTKVVGRKSLQYILYTQVKTESGFPLFCEVYQRAPMGPVDVVVGDCEELEHTLLMINKNPGAYLFYYLTTVAKMEQELVKTVIKVTIDPTFTNDIDNCTWDEVKLVLATPQEAENKKMAVMEKAAWYKDAYGENVFDMNKQEKKKQISSVELEDLRAEPSVKTVTMKPGEYEGSPGAETFIVGKKAAQAKQVTIWTNTLRRSFYRCCARH